ncbi:adhesion G protein-coupled receptor F5-like [Pseudophryne corroboree]|uniref:adhesion G protein-coupled receptor F5-like n=1 Tax=Pseudophryne corroboree TaxID=495146 RepID=UPI00308163B6
MATLSPIPHLLLFLLLFETFMAENVDADFYPSAHEQHNFSYTMDDHMSLIRRPRAVAASGLPSSYQATFEISFPDPSFEAEIRSYLLDMSIYQPLTYDSIAISSVDLSPACSISGSTATCSCGKDYECIGTSGLCDDTNCICVTTIPLQEFCIPKLTIAMYPETLFHGDTLTIVCNFTEVTTISWYLNSNDITNNPSYNTSYSLQGTRVSYMLNKKNVSASDAGTYTCAVTVNGNNQAQSTTISKITELAIDLSGNNETFCDGATFNLTCCTKGIPLLSGTWTVNGKSGTSISNATCTTYIITPSVAECTPAPSSSMYTCKLQRREGATALKTITVTYWPRATFTASPNRAVSAGKVLSIRCQTSFTANSIDLQILIDTTSTVLNSTSNTNSNTFTISKTSAAWSGIFICIIRKSSLTSSANITVEIVPLPSSASIQVYPLQSYVGTSGINQQLNCCVRDANYTIYFTNGITNTPATNSAKLVDQTCYMYNLYISGGATGNTTINCVVVNLLGDRATSANMIISPVEDSTKSCPATVILPVTPNSKTFLLSCSLINPLQLGNIIYTCNNGIWDNGTNECYSSQIFTQVQNVQDVITGPEAQQNIASVLTNITSVATELAANISSSPQNIKYMVQIISTISTANVTVSPPVMENYIKTVDIVINNTNTLAKMPNDSSSVLQSVEKFAQNLQFNDSVNITNDPTSTIQLIGKILHPGIPSYGNFMFPNVTGNVSVIYRSIPGNSGRVVSLAYTSMKDILPQDKPINGLVMSTVLGNIPSKDIDEDNFSITMLFIKNHASDKTPECAWFDFDLQVWNNSGCSTVEGTDNVNCTCNHLTSFSVLLADVQESYLDIITYAGVGISLGCLFITLVIEVLVWRSVIKNKTSYLRHVCLVNIAVTLLVADIWFIIGAALEKYPSSPACQTAAFFSFYFYLSLFFWMLTNGLVLFYRLIYILHDMSRRVMMMIAFTLGYGCPLLIAVVTVASTEPGRFTSQKFCWLSYYGSKSFLAFVVPALTIVFINLIILAVVICKLLRPVVGERPGQEDRQVVVVIAKTIAVLTPLLGTTWLFGLILVSDPTNKVINGIFAALNSFQGLFILISTVLLDQKVRTAVRSSISSYYLNTRRTNVQTTSTNSSTPSKPVKTKNIFAKKGGYNFFAAQSSSNETSADSYSVLA